MYKRQLQLDVELAEPAGLMPLVARVRGMFDLDANPQVIAGILGQDPALAPLLARWPGIRSPGCGSVYESSIRAILGQQISTVAARNLCGRLAAACTREGEPTAFPSAARLAALDDTHFPMPGRRRDTLRQLCRSLREREDQLDLETLASIPGIGPWTTAMVAMRGAGDPDAFPVTDLGVGNAWAALGEDTHLKIRQADWRPWRAYAANLLWRSLSP